MPSLPTVGGSTDTWGTELNDWLLVDHNADGTNIGGGGDATQLAYVERTTTLSVTATAEGSAQEVVSAGAVSFDGSTRVCIEAFIPVIQGDAGIVVFNLWEGSTDLGYVGEAGPTATGTVMIRRFLTPAAGSKTYALKAWRSGSDKTLSCGAGGSGNFNPGYIRITRV